MSVDWGNGPPSVPGYPYDYFAVRTTFYFKVRKVAKSWHVIRSRGGRIAKWQHLHAIMRMMPPLMRSSCAAHDA